MQKVVGSNPISRFRKAPLRRGFLVERRGRIQSFVPKLCPEIARGPAAEERLPTERGVRAAVLHPRLEVASEEADVPPGPEVRQLSAGDGFVDPARFDRERAGGGLHPGVDPP